MKFYLRETAELVVAVVIQAIMVSVVPMLAVIDIPIVVIALHYFIHPRVAAQSLLIYTIILLSMGSVPAWGPLVIVGIFVGLHLLISTVFTTKTSLSYAWESLLIAVTFGIIRYGFAGFEFFAPPNIGMYIIIQTIMMYGAHEVVSNFSDQLR